MLNVIGEFIIKIKKRRLCCNYVKNCVGKKCHKNLKGCKFIGGIVTFSSNKNCHWRKLSPQHSRQICCYTKKKCNGKKCRIVKRTCDYKGPVVIRTPKKKMY